MSSTPPASSAPLGAAPSSSRRNAVTGILLAARHHCRVIHHVPGRLRLRFDPTGLAAALPRPAQGLSRLLEGAAGIHDIEINSLACSLLVTYDPAMLPPATWHRLVAGTPPEAAEALADLLDVTLGAADAAPAAG